MPRANLNQRLSDHDDKLQTGISKLELSMLAEDRVHGYQPDNIFARLSVHTLGSEVTILEREQGMKRLLDALGHTVVGRSV